MTTEHTKKCRTCERDLPATTEHFHRDFNLEDMLTNQCKKCNKEWRQLNSERIRAYQKKYRDTHPEKIRAYRELRQQKARARKAQFLAEQGGGTDGDN